MNRAAYATTARSQPVPSAPDAGVLRRAYESMRGANGHQAWWPGETPFEMCIGAILTQNTSWKNVERAIAQLKSAGVMDPEHLHSLTEGELAELIRPAGCFRVKARRIHAFLSVLVEECGGSLPRLFAGDTETARTRLLAIPGIGPETADCMLLYAGGHPSFVVDAYTRRIFSRHGWCRPVARYDEVQRLCSRTPAEVRAADMLDYWQDYHAQLVAVGKNFCRARIPDCSTCPLKSFLPANGPEAFPMST